MGSLSGSVEDAIGETSTKHAPWFIIPADDKWYERLAIATVIDHYFDQLDLSYPTVNESQKAALQKAKLQLMAEGGSKDQVSKIKKNAKT